MNYVGDFSGLQSEKDTKIDFLLNFKGPVCKKKICKQNVAERIFSFIQGIKTPDLFNSFLVLYLDVWKQ